MNGELSREAGTPTLQKYPSCLRTLLFRRSLGLGSLEAGEC